ncbi:dTDP-4-dehydrorhamnose reductase [Formosa sp. S-31]|uniref:dTDP-4-dehydrorhamnose reductase n=1 Tax=Formosa sp. S-31 TaxID=2790949 RepID=UPI003EC0BC80
MINVLVTGGNGQLAACIKDVTKEINLVKCIYTDSEDLDITAEDKVNQYFKDNKIDWVINCAAYTAVDKAESEMELAVKVNKNGAKHLAIACKNHKAKLIHISTDFVFDGKSSSLYKETDEVNPLGVYGLTKLQGEQEIQNYCEEFFIFRTSWLYSEHANNFMKTMLKLAESRTELKVVADQIGTPTYATDLAEVMLKIILEDNSKYGLYHYSNEGVASWYDFAYAIFELGKTSIHLYPIKSVEYPTPAERPKFSVMDKSKIKETFKLEIPYWRDSLKHAINKL